MQLTKGAIGNLINRYKAVLKKCHLMNTFGSLAVAGMLVMGGAGVAGAADDVALEGKNTYDSAETPTVNHLMGGWLVNTPETAGNAKGDITLTVNGGTISEIIGGSYAQGLTAENNELLTVTHGNITTTISGEKTTSAEFVVGGSKVAGGAGAKLKTGKTSLTINGGTFGTQGKTNDYELVMGGNYAKTAGSSNLTATTEGSSVAVNGGTFHASVVGGSVAHNYSGAGITNVFDNGNTSVTITGGTFNSSESSLTDGQGGINLKAAVIGGGLAYGANTSTVLGSSDNPVTSSVTIDGKNTQVNGKVVAGSVVANGGYAALVHGDTLLSMIGGTVNDDLVGGGMVQDAAPLSDEKPNSNLIVTGNAGVMVAGGTAKGEIVGGNYVRGDGSARVKNSTVSITGGTFAPAADSQNKAQYVIGGNKSMAYAGDTAKTLVKKDSGVLVDGDVTIADGAVVGGSMAKAEKDGKATATVEGNSSVTVNNATSLAGVVGGGLAETYSHTNGGAATSSVGGTSSVTINGGTINGIAYGAVAGNAGTSSAAVVGGGLANGDGSTATVDSTSVTIAGGKINGKVVAGGLAINGGTTTAGENTLLTMTGGEVTGDLIGGNLLDKNGNEGSPIAGSTVNVEGGTVAGEIYGGSYVRNTAATSNVNNTTVNISGGTIGAIKPQGWAQYVVGGGKAMSNATVTESSIMNTATVNISGGGITRGAVVGGGFARAQGASGSATADVKDSVVNLTGGTLVGVVGGGLAENLGTAGSSATATAGVTTASLTIDGNATVSGIIYKGNDGEETPSSAAVIGGGLAYNKKGSTAVASVKTASTTINGGTINGDVYAGGMADGAGAQANVDNASLTISGGTITGDVYAGGYALNTGTATVANATVTFDGNSSFAKTVQGGNATNSTLAFTNYDGTFDGLVTGFDHLNVADGSTLKLQTLSTGTADEGSKGVFNEKALTLTGAGNVEADAVDVATGNGLSVEDGTLNVTNSLKSAEAGDGTKGINVSDNGVLRAANNLLVKNEGNISTADGLKKLYLGQGGTLAVTGLASISTADMQQYRNVLVVNGSTGLIKYEGAAIEISEADQATTPGNLKGEVAEKTGALLTGTTVEYGASLTNTTTINGNYGAETVLISNAADAPHTVELKGDLTLLGEGDGKNLITVEGEGTPTLSQVNVAGGKALNLGSAAAHSQGGKLGADVHLGNGSSLNAVAGDYTVGAVTGDGGVVSSSAGGSLVADAIGGLTTPVATVKASQGSIHSLGGINTTTLTIEGGAVSSVGNINVIEPVKDMNGTLTAGGDITLSNGATNAQGRIVTGDNLILGGNITKAADGQLTLRAQQGTIEAANITATNVAAKKLAASGAVAVDGGVLNLTGTGTDASTVDSLKLTNGTQATVADLKLTGTGTITVGTDGDTVGGTTLSAKHIDLNGGMLLGDPAWGLTSSNVAVASMGSTPPATADVIVNGDVGVGRNSYLALGTADTSWLPGVVGNYTKGVGLSKDGITAALGVFKGIEIADGEALVVNGGLMDTAATGNALTTAVTSADPNSAEFANNSLLVVNGANIYGDKAAITFAHTGGGTLSVAEGAKLLVTDAVAGQDYTIVTNAAAVQDGTSTLANGGTVWKTEGLSTTTDMISLGDAKFDSTGKKVTTSAVRNDAHTVFPNLSDGMANAVNDLYTGHAGAAGQPNWDYADVNSDQMGVRFLSRATDNRFLGMDKNAAAESIESAARIAFAGAAPQMTKMASDAGTNAVVNRLGFADPADGAQAMDADGKIVDRNTTGFALWIAPLWQSQHGWGLDAGNMDYGFNGNLGGVSLGADYTFENAIRAGITFNIGGGYAESSGGDLSSTENRMNFWGLGAYAGWNYENFGVMADVSYTSTWNQLKQDLDSRLGMGNKLEADVQASAISAGLRAEYLLQTSAMDIIPHIGVRYMSLNTWGYDVDTHGGTVLEGDSLHQDIWTFPIGVTFSKDFALDSGWNFKPSLDFTVIPAAGDIKAKHDVHFTGLPGTYEVETQMMDYLTWQGGVGLELANDNMSIGVNYTLQAGQHTTGHGVFGSFRYEF